MHVYLYRWASEYFVHHVRDLDISFLCFSCDEYGTPDGDLSGGPERPGVAAHCDMLFHKDCLINYLQNHNDCPVCGAQLFQHFRPERVDEDPVKFETFDQLLEYAQADRLLSLRDHGENVPIGTWSPTIREYLSAVYAEWKKTGGESKIEDLGSRYGLSVEFITFIIYLKAFSRIGPSLEFSPWREGYNTVKEKLLLATSQLWSWVNPFEERIYILHCPELTYKVNVDETFDVEGDLLELEGPIAAYKCEATETITQQMEFPDNDFQCRIRRKLIPFRWRRVLAVNLVGLNQLEITIKEVLPLFEITTRTVSHDKFLRWVDVEAGMPDWTVKCQLLFTWKHEADVAFASVERDEGQEALDTSLVDPSLTEAFPGDLSLTDTSPEDTSPEDLALTDNSLSPSVKSESL